MNKTKLFTFLLIASTFFIACSKADEDTTSVATEETADDLASYIATSMTSSNEGLLPEMDNSISLAAESADNLLKSISSDTIYTNDSTITLTGSDNYGNNFNYELNANYGIISEATSTYDFFYNGEMTFTYAGTNLDYHKERTSNWLLSGLESSADNYVLNGTVSSSYNSVYDSSVDIIDMTYDKSTLAILSGSMEWIIVYHIDSTDYTYSAAIVFNGDGTAKITINSYNYTVDLETGDIS